MGTKLSTNDIAAIRSLNVEVARKNVKLLSKAFLAILHSIFSQPDKPIREYQEIDQTYMFYDFLESDFEEMSLFDFLHYPNFEEFALDVEHVYCDLHVCIDTTQVLLIVGRLQYLECILQNQIAV